LTDVPGGRTIATVPGDPPFAPPEVPQQVSEAPMKIRTVGIILVAAITLGALPAAGQTIAEIARQEATRRKAVAAKSAKSKVYTEEDLKRFRRPSTTGSGTDAAAKAAGEVAAAVGQPGPTVAAPTPPAPDPAKEEAAWHDRITAVRTRLDRSKLLLDALQSRVNALTNDFYSRDDPAQRALIAADRSRALAEMDRVAQDIKDATKEIADIEEEARRAGVPPGWLR
jgi:hypothetical protein